ncbi:MAG: hypothetical protein LUE27_02335 [Clostridia bacterium]|nr:hypothetical protein [Clostridia bacterium]
MGREYSVSLDLGSDSVKIACAFLGKNGKETVLKVVDPRYSEIAIPAVACYDDETRRWLFGYQVGRSNERTYATVVKIKDLLNIITLNGAYYSGCSRFPLFEFPITNTVPESYYRNYRPQGYASLYDKYFFSAAPATPKSVCEQFFAYVAGVISGFFSRLLKELFTPMLNISYTLVVPPKASSVFVEELQRLFVKAVDEEGGYAGNVQVQSSAKVLGMLAAYYDGLGAKGTESALLFDIGEERISVVKFTKLARGNGSSFNIDGITGHSEPQKLGGNDIDKALVEEIEKQIIGMEAVGAEVAGKKGFIHETGLRSNNFLFMKSVKAAKTILGREFRKGEETDYPDGVPVSIIRDVDIYQNITQDEFARGIGINPGGRTCVSGSVAYRIGNYIAAELSTYRSTDANAKKIYLTGGAAGTAGLAEFVQAVVDNVDSGKKVRTFADCFKSAADTAYSVKDTDIFSYGPSVGAALVALRKDRIMVCLTKSYGTIAYLTKFRGEADGGNRRFYSVIANMGSVLDFENRTMQTCTGEFRERYVTDAKGNVQYKEYSQTYFLSKAESDGIYIYSSSVTDSSVFPDDADVPEDIQKLYRDRACGIGIGAKPVSYFAHVGPSAGVPTGVLTVHNCSYGKVFLATPTDNSYRDAKPIDRDLLPTLENELGFKLEGGGSGSKVCVWYRNKNQLVTSLTVKDGFASNSSKVYFVDVGVRIDKEGIAVTFARMTENKSGESSNRGKTFDIVYRCGQGTRYAYNVPPNELIVDFNRTISVDTGESLH